MGPYFLDIFDPRAWGHESNVITLEVMRIVLATGLFAIGVELPKSYMARHAKSLLAMVIPTMAIGWIIVAGREHFLLPNDQESSIHARPSSSALSSTEFHLLFGDLRMSNANGSDNLRSDHRLVIRFVNLWSPTNLVRGEVRSKACAP